MKKIIKWIAIAFVVLIVIAVIAGKDGAETTTSQTAVSEGAEPVAQDSAEASDNLTVTQKLTDTLVDSQMSAASDKVARDSIEKYEMVKRQGSAIDACVHAGIVSAAYLQAKDETKYSEWKAIEKADCAAAGMPQ